MSEFKVGDRVKVLRAFTDEETAGSNWLEDMESTVGKVGEIDVVFEDGDIGVSFTEEPCSWAFPPSVLEKVED